MIEVFMATSLVVVNLIAIHYISNKTRSLSNQLNQDSYLAQKKIQNEINLALCAMKQGSLFQVHTKDKQNTHEINSIIYAMR